ncbi:hypothetical protein [Allorhizobium borbori]|uniref:Uncharacterized protein n=1 Tax=Allorhizobium borbori TaxID=485907 RepID=A0A7W6K1Q4_9HYPH|nr:hypothetical protein [Allorhizobium borbori]MBB4103543.1 hypothetical protein [Allorhizobium borbori]
MSAPALIKQADLKRIAAVARSENVTITIEIGGGKFTVSPIIQDIHTSKAVDADITYGGNSLASWRNRRADKSRGNP